MRPAVPAAAGGAPAPEVSDETGLIERPRRPSVGWVLAVGAVLLLWVLLPTSGLGPTSVAGWADQQLFRRAFEELLATGRSAASESGSVGPAYLALAKLLRRVTGVGPDAALILLNRASFVVILAGVLGASLNRAGAGVRACWPVLAALALACLATPWWLYSDIPWTHPVAAALLVVAVSSIRLGSRAPVAGGAAFGTSTLLLLQTRAFEGQALLAACALGLGLAALLALVRGRPRPSAAALARRWWRPLAAALAGAALAVLLVGRTTGQYGLFRQYAAAGQEANLSLSAGSVPVKLVQLFVDPCYRSFCQGLTDYTPQGLTPDSLLGYWQQPLLMQLPFLLPSVLVLIVSVILLLRHRLVLPLDAVVAAIAAAGLVFGYTANPIAGGAHLKYGFVRDFTAPAALLLYAAARCTVAVLRARAAAPPSDRRGLGWLPLTAGALAVALSLVPGFRLPRLEPVLVDYGLAADTGCSTVARAGCGLRFVGRDASGRQHDLDDRGILLLRCNGRHAGTFASSGALPEGVADAARACSATAGVPLRVAYLPVELGVYQTPEGTSLLDAHVLEVP